MNEEIPQEEFDVKIRKAIHELYPKQIAEGKIFETETGWHGLKLKN